MRKGDKPRDYRVLACQLLQLANRGLLRSDFQREFSKRLIRFSGCDAVMLWLKDHDKYYPSLATRFSRRPFRIDFRISPPSDAPRTEKSPCDPASPSLVLKNYPSRLSLSLMVGRKEAGHLLLQSGQRNFFNKEDVTFYHSLAPVLGIALVHRHLQVELRERVKELTCLYEIARLGARGDLSEEKVLAGIVERLPPAWLYPSIACARILFDNRSYSTRSYQNGLGELTADIVIDGTVRGKVEVAYLDKKPDIDEGPFMKEERKLIDAVAGETALILKRRQGEEEKLRLEDQLRRADRLVTIGQLAAGVAHELNEPLGSILGFAQLVKKNPGLPSQAGQDIDKILNASLDAREVVKKLLLSARQMPPRRIPVNLNDLVEGLDFLRSRCLKEGVALIQVLAPDLPEIDADPSQLKQILVNLVVNALQAMPEGGTLRLRTENRGDAICLVVEDTGVGMSEEVLKEIFTPFFTTKDVGQGTGLGLPVVHGIVTSHGGSIRVESRVGMGTRFEISLPLEEGQKMKKRKVDGRSK